ncbi:MAG TPA: ELM1/GtrOC1 family putative glycosyltransferase [Sphingomicrobium sp.]|nr:ELM1/GtrOC1 family putative glycosyltransferase [Sphingomicrobium sp.]
MSDPPRIWVLLGARVGDNNQLLALAEAFRLPFETRTMGYRRRWIRWLRLFPTLPFLLDRRSRRTLGPPWPDLVIGIGRRSVAVARWIRWRNRGRTSIVRLGNPRADPTLFDLVLTTPQYPVPQADNVVVLPLSMRRHREIVPQPGETAWLERLPRPHLLLSLGGVTRFWTLANEVVADSAARLAERAAAAGGTLIVIGSPRTAPDTIEAVKAAVGGRPNVATDPPVRFPVLLADADEHCVTADSVSMISEAVMTGKPVALVPVELDEEGQEELGREQGYSSEFRDLRRFWAELDRRGLAGTVDSPRSGTVEDPVAIAVAAVKRLLGDRVE